MAPYRVDEVFAINPNFRIKFENEIVIIDNLFVDWVKIRNLFYDTPAPIFNLSLIHI